MFILVPCRIIDLYNVNIYIYINETNSKRVDNYKKSFNKKNQNSINIPKK